MTEHEQYLLEKIRLDQERHAVQIKAGVIAKWKPTFEKVGFDDYDIDFSSVCRSYKCYGRSYRKFLC